MGWKVQKTDLWDFPARKKACGKEGIGVKVFVLIGEQLSGSVDCTLK